MNRLATQGIFAILFLASALLLMQCTSSKNTTGSTSQKKGLKDYYKDYFYIGAAVSPQGLKRPEEAELVIDNFSSMTPENAMKMGPIHPQENQFFWKDADSIIAFAKEHHLKVRGHCLCWHNQTPRWLFIDSSQGRADTVSKELLLKRLHDHIMAVVSRYKGSVYAWDVCNEVISDNSNSDEYFRNSAFYRICGEDFVAKAFEYAHEADPNAILFYNDYNETNPVKRAKIIRMVKGLQAKGIPISGVGLQAHWSSEDLREGQVDSTLSDFSKLGLKIQITELDLKVQGNRRDSTVGYTPEREKRQTEQYAMIFRKFRQYRNVIQSVTFWNVSDKYTWLDRRGPGGRAYPLLFDTAYQPKKAYYEVVNFDPKNPTEKKGF